MKSYIAYQVRKINRFLLKVQTNSKIKGKCNIAFNCKFGGRNLINRYCKLNNVEIGYGTYIGESSILSNCKIGKFCSIASNCKTLVGTHPTKKFVSTHPAFFSLLKQSGFTYVKEKKFEEFKFLDKDNKISVIIGSDVWIGSDVKILDGIKIGDGAVIGASSLVINDIEPFAIYAGIPAKKIGERFTKEEQHFLQKYKWWDKDIKDIEKYSYLFDDIEKFKSHFLGGV